MFRPSLFALLIGSFFCAAAQAENPPPPAATPSNDTARTAPIPLFRGQYSRAPEHKEPSLAYSESDLAGIAPGMVGNAYVWATVGTLAPMAASYLISAAGGNSNSKDKTVALLFVSGALFGPSAGQFYARSPGQGILGLGIRSLGALVTVAGVGLILENIFCGIDDEGSSRSCSDNGGTVMAVAGLLTYAGGAAYSFVDTRTAVYRYRGRVRESGFGWAPTIRPGRDGDLRTGAVAYFRF